MSKAILATNSSMTRSRDLSPLRQNLNRHRHWPYTKKYNNGPSFKKILRKNPQIGKNWQKISKNYFAATRRQNPQKVFNPKKILTDKIFLTHEKILAHEKFLTLKTF